MTHTNGDDDFFCLEIHHLFLFSTSTSKRISLVRSLSTSLPSARLTHALRACSLVRSIFWIRPSFHSPLRVCSSTRSTNSPSLKSSLVFLHFCRSWRRVR